ncbi:FAD-binding oxidoreductase [Anaeromyxobacter diazotrophicus]|uniref:FAD-binding protein n=1 Tax=Anaeromyxobacter diazotrophicus TaxID=2590199 RepID=A0A7I9VPJ7_9BACT|nr:FAD-linked oxidase C-terminal domain-containing protein [Anaeromyxobacter diazotrophicus]GEJ58281.1 FAD-binding protein [Anaeromyxobacter diazotrophicus]
MRDAKILAAAAAALREPAGPGAALAPQRVQAEPEQLEPYGRDESDLGTHLPDLVVLPESAAEVQRVLAVAARHRLPVTPIGARSGRSGGALPLAGGIALSLERMNRILDIRPEDLTARVQPGVVTGVFQAEVEKHGLFYPPDPNSLDMCFLGGNVAENAGGPRALKYGVTREYVLGLEVALPTGELLRTGKQTIKGVAGYDLTALFVGSEGTLGVVTEITFKLLPRPRHVSTALVVFRSVEDAARAISRVLAAGVIPRVLELLDDTALAACARTAPYKFPADAGAAVLIETDGNDEEQVFGEIVRVAELVQADASGEVIVAQNEAQRRDIWETRKKLSVNLRALHPLKLSEDIAVPRSRIPEMVRRTREIGARHGFLVATYGHAGDGNLHANVLFDREEDRPRVEAAVGEILHAAVDMGGTITGEHGVGLAKRDYLVYEQGEAQVALQRRLKAVFDPLGIMNPGKIFPEPEGAKGAAGKGVE